MAEALAVLGGVGSIFSIIDGISKITGIISDLRTKWDDADLTLLSLASQLTALRAASIKIQEWIDQDLQDAHHQLIMDLDVSVSCCRLLISKIESFFTDLAQLTEKPLDLRNKFKVVFGSAGPESVQRLIERQASALTLLLTACNCKTLSEQQRHLETTKSRKVLNRAKADSMSLYVQRDTASLTSRITDNLSKISRVFDFDSNVFGTKVYERAFRGSVKDMLRRQQQRPIQKVFTTSELSRDVYLYGEDQTGVEKLINAIEDHTHYPSLEWIRHRAKMQNVALELVINIVKLIDVDWKEKETSILLAYSSLPPRNEIRPTHEKALEACALVWWSALLVDHEPDSKNQDYVREKISHHEMVFHVDIIPAGGLNIYCGNAKARIFMDRMEKILPVRQTEPRYVTPLLADRLLASLGTNVHEMVAYRLNFAASDSPRIISAVQLEQLAHEALHSQTTLAYAFDLQYHGHRSSTPLRDLLARIELTSSMLTKAYNEIPILFIFNNLNKFGKRIASVPFPTADGYTIDNTDEVLAHIKTCIESTLQASKPHFSVLYVDDELNPVEILARIYKVANEASGFIAPSVVTRKDRDAQAYSRLTKREIYPKRIPSSGSLSSSFDITTDVAGPGLEMAVKAQVGSFASQKPMDDISTYMGEIPVR